MAKDFDPVGRLAGMSLDRETEHSVAEFCRTVLREDPIPGMSVAVVDGTRTLYTDGFGSRNLAGNTPATPKTLYGIGSVTKSFVALSVLQLQDAGLLDVDDPVTDHLDVDLSDEITLHHLLSHSSGYPSLGVSELLIARRTRRSVETLPMADMEDFYAHLHGADSERAAPPGERFAYCNTGYTLLGDVIEACTGKPFAEYVGEQIFTPLGMARTTFDENAFARDDDHMTPYLVEDGDLIPSSLPAREVGRPAGGIVAPVTELADYVRLHINEGSSDGERIVESETLARAHEGHVETPGGAYGYGWFRDDVRGRDLVGHSGSIGVASAYAGFVPGEGVGVALAANTSPSYPLGVVGKGVLATVLGGDAEDVPFFRRRRRLSELTGEYESYRGVVSARVEADGNTLRMSFDTPLGGQSEPLVPAGEAGEADWRTFYTVGPEGERATVEFREGDGGISLLVDRWHLHKVGPA